MESLTPGPELENPYRGENPEPGKDVHGELDPWPGIREQPRSNASVQVRRSPNSRHHPARLRTSRRAITGNDQPYSITSSAVASSDDGTSRPSALAVLRLITNSNLLGNCTGRSAGFLLAD